ncbi:hypothetical protein SMICM304S_05623 [Streptomyces microflavus]
MRRRPLLLEGRRRRRALLERVRRRAALAALATALVLAAGTGPLRSERLGGTVHLRGPRSLELERVVLLGPATGTAGTTLAALSSGTALAALSAGTLLGSAGALLGQEAGRQVETGRRPAGATRAAGRPVLRGQRRVRGRRVGEIAPPSQDGAFLDGGGPRARRPPAGPGPAVTASDAATAPRACARSGCVPRTRDPDWASFGGGRGAPEASSGPGSPT